jgi:hypothetical protein
MGAKSFRIDDPPKFAESLLSANCFFHNQQFPKGFSQMTRMIASFKIMISVAFLSIVGCSETPAQSDPSKAKEMIQQVLNAWKSGKTSEEWQQDPSKITAVDRHWQQGTKLLEFEIMGDPQPNGFDQQVVVQLSLQDKSGKKFKEKANYSVSTTPKLVIVRIEG